MEPMLELLVVNRKGLSEKWWHRLANVVIYGSTTLLAIAAAILVYTDASWKLKEYTAYSFESGYQQADGKEVPCSFYSYEYVSPTIYCGNIHSSYELLLRYTAARGTQDQLKKNKTESGATDDQIVNASIRAGKFSDVRVKEVIIPQTDVLLKDIGIALAVVAGWLIFWESIIYRAFVYIVLGKKK